MGYTDKPDSDFFSGLTSNSISKNFSLIFAILTSIIIPFFLCSIVWYEKYGSDQRRTLVNKFASCGCWCAIEYLLFPQVADIIRYFHGPLPKYFCLFVRITKSAIFLQMFFYFDLIILSRYAYVFWLKNPAGFNDDFWVSFCNMWVMMMSLLTKSVQHLIINQQTLTYYFCCGTDPRLETDYNIKPRNHYENYNWI